MRPACRCGHDYAGHDTGWDASGCMVGQCACRSYFPPNALKEPTARELLDSLHARCPVAGCPSCELIARVEAVLALIKDRKRIGGLINPAELERILNGEGAPRLSTEEEALRVMGDGQPLVKMREIK